MAAPNILLLVKHDTSKQGKIYTEDAYSGIREQLSRLLTEPYAKRLKYVWCVNIEHHSFETQIIITAADKTYEITKVCCIDYENKINIALINVQKEN